MEDAENFCRRHWQPLARALGAYVGDDALGQDLAQEALARVLARWGRVRRMGSPGGYAYRVGVNLARDALGAQARDRRAVPGATATDIPGAIDPADPSVRLVVTDAVHALPERQRLAVSLRYLADLSVAQTAQAMRCRPGTVKALCHQATQALRASPELSWHDRSTVPDPATDHPAARPTGVRDA